MYKKIFLLISFINTIFALPTILEVNAKTIDINGKSSKIISITQPDGTWGYYAKDGSDFDVVVKNNLSESTVLHWHGLELPNNQDGTELTQEYIPPHGEYHYKFKLHNAGTFWIHSHYELQQVSLAAAPLIITEPNDDKYQQVVVMFQDFTFTAPNLVLSNLTGSSNNMHMNMEHMDMGGNSHHSMHMSDADLNDVKYDAFLTNLHTPEAPEIKYIKPGKVKLRFINGSVSSNFWINLGKLHGVAVAVDGRPIKPFSDTKYQLSEGQRIDIIVDVPKSGGVFPIIGQVEGLKNQTGLILTTDNQVSKVVIPHNATKAVPALNNNEEIKLVSQIPWSDKPVTQVIKYNMTGSMSPYLWKINNQLWPNVKPVMVKQGDRVELDFINNTPMEHPMHLHGYGFKVVEVNGKKINGAIRDTVLVLPQQTVKVQFDAIYPGKWFIHCHIGWHMMTGMMTYVNVLPR